MSTLGGAVLVHDGEATAAEHQAPHGGLPAQDPAWQREVRSPHDALRVPRLQPGSGKVRSDFLPFKLYYVFYILSQIYTGNHTTFPVQMYAITV